MASFFRDPKEGEQTRDGIGTGQSSNSAPQRDREDNKYVSDPLAYEYSPYGHTNPGVDQNSYSGSKIVKDAVMGAWNSLKKNFSPLGAGISAIKAALSSRENQIAAALKSDLPHLTDEQATKGAKSILDGLAKRYIDTGDKPSRDRDGKVVDLATGYTVIPTTDGTDGTNDGTDGTETDNGERTSLFDQYIDKFYADENNVEDLILADADHKRQAGQQYVNTISGATDKQSELIQDIISKTREGRDGYAPTTFTIQGQPISFLNRGARNTGNFLMDAGQKDFDNIDSTAGKILATAGITSPSSGDLAYLDKLLEGAKNQEDVKNILIDQKYRQEALDKGFDLSQQRLDLEEPSFLQKAGQLIDIGSNFFDFDKIFS